MTAGGRSSTGEKVEPQYELECLFDDMDEPSRVTIFYPRGERTVSEWVTVDVETARPIDEIR